MGKNKVANKKKPSVAFDRAISNVYENNIFPKLSHVLADSRLR
jgi:hypothetical protein